MKRSEFIRTGILAMLATAVTVPKLLEDKPNVLPVRKDAFAIYSKVTGEEHFHPVPDKFKAYKPTIRVGWDNEDFTTNAYTVILYYYEREDSRFIPA